jgi:hypothetical protein
METLGAGGGQWRAGTNCVEVDVPPPSILEAKKVAREKAQNAYGNIAICTYYGLKKEKTFSIAPDPAGCLVSQGLDFIPQDT